MFRRPLLRTLAVLVIFLAFTTPLCEAAVRPSAPSRAGRVSSPSPLSTLWDWMTSVWAKAGCSLDPGGACSTGSNPTGLPVAPGALDEGCGIDPGGRTCGGHS